MRRRFCVLLVLYRRSGRLVAMGTSTQAASLEVFGLSRRVCSNKVSRSRL